MTKAQYSRLLYDMQRIKEKFEAQEITQEQASILLNAVCRDYEQIKAVFKAEQIAINKDFPDIDLTFSN